MSKIADLAALIVEQARHAQRFVTAIAGPPGAGKSTLADALAEALPANRTAVLQADAFHYDNALLDRLGCRSRKGAPDTFDCKGFGLMLQRIGNREAEIVIPTFDRKLDVSRAGAVMVGQDIKFVIVEGNYLALDSGPWSGLRRHFDLTVFVDVARDELERRLLKRWIDLGHSHDAAREKVRDNDLLNANLVLEKSRSCDFVWTSSDRR